MAWDNEHVPVVRVQAQDNFSDDLTSMAKLLKDSGNEDLAKLVLQDKARLKKNIPKAINKIANDEVDGAQKLIKERQYHSKSGYVGHGNLWKSVAKHPSRDGMKSDIYANAESIDGYEYIQAFEYGLKNKNYPAHHVMHDSGMALDVDKYSDEIIRKSIK
ncbi:hypothetical protein C5L30_000340 [Companilactobacillus farciminis]|jgi:hypothetical protein|uniref:HK97 gp10 family phage protein n=1 Tax=Companilactobacillus farciminis TaxID=1612 RepID=A0A4R5NK68_9LACO|nr:MULTISPECIES: hypothetical protein [Companilactobacillus]ATO46019.1 hypothetical protein LF20184_04280 [Companilactobacillus farciminis KCTC 3681 = DSM 20184]KRK61356.1 hypothetical protein FC68_GL001117 [Companilactobacillus farciminis KCTC 3681 = DSM 20184]TDG74624.1 hypothetical protein C5L30_000340 [Companilactobacillus farciminis]